MPEYELDDRQRGVVEELVRVCREQADPGEFVFCAYREDSVFHFKKSGQRVSALPLDGRILADQKLVLIQWNSHDAGPGRVLPEAFRAVKRGFIPPTGNEYHLTDRQWELAAALAQVGETYQGDFFWRPAAYGQESAIVWFHDRDLKLPASKGDLETLREYGWITIDYADDGSAACQIQGGLYPAAQCGFQRPPMAPHPVHHTKIDHVQVIDSQGVAFGSGNVVRVVPTAPSDLAAALEDLRRRADQLTDQQEAVRVVLQDLADVIEAGHAQRPGWMGQVQRLSEAAKPFVEFVNSLTALSERLLPK